MKNYADRWLRGFGFAIRVWFAFGVALGPPTLLARFVTDSASMPDWLSMGICLAALGYALVFGPVVLDWIAGKMGFVSPLAGSGTGGGARRGR